MNEFIKKNKSLLRSYRLITRIIGWMLLIVALVIAVVKLLSGFDMDDQLRFYMIYRLIQGLVLSYVLLGLILLGLAQFVRYLYQSEYQPGLILRHGDKVLYLYALALIINPILDYFYRMKIIGMTYANTDSLFLYLLIILLPAIARALIFVGMAKVLKRMIPMVEESKTLV
ncbi:MAG: hypothetical protein ACYTFW_14450 [Planctomycetota bacterium]|jgi:hypothetical protein